MGRQRWARVLRGLPGRQYPWTRAAEEWVDYPASQGWLRLSLFQLRYLERQRWHPEWLYASDTQCLRGLRRADAAAQDVPADGYYGVGYRDWCAEDAGTAVVPHRRGREGHVEGAAPQLGGR